jgi:hypothetical protein
LRIRRVLSRMPCLDAYGAPALAVGVPRQRDHLVTEQGASQTAALPEREFGSRAGPHE